MPRNDNACPSRGLLGETHRGECLITPISIGVGLRCQAKEYRKACPLTRSIGSFVGELTGARYRPPAVGTLVDTMKTVGAYLRLFLDTLAYCRSAVINTWHGLAFDVNARIFIGNCRVNENRNRLLPNTTQNPGDPNRCPLRKRNADV